MRQSAGEEFHSQGRAGVLERNASVRNELAPPGATPTVDTQPRRLADFDTIGEALDYAAKGRRGPEFPRRARHAGARLSLMPSCARTRSRTARRFVALGIKPGDRIALIAETGAEFAACFFGAIYAGAWPVPLPLPTCFGGRDAYIDQLAVQLKSCDPALLLYPPELSEFCGDAAAQGRRRGSRLGQRSPASSRPRPTCRAAQAGRHRLSAIFERIDPLPARRRDHPPRAARQPRAHGDRHEDRGQATAASPGCPGITTWAWSAACCRRSPTQISVDYLKTEDFARRPLAWLDLITRNPGTTLSYSPTFGYDICARRMSSQTTRRDRFDLSRWRVAGNGADMIRPDVMQAFVDCLRRRRASRRAPSARATASPKRRSPSR